MKALMKTARGEGHVEVVEIPEPVAGPGEVRVAVRRAGVCGTDIHILHDEFSKLRVPVVMGHEFAGVIDAVGPGVTRWKPGDRVICESEAASCQACEYCRAGRNNLCTDREAFGYIRNGAFTKYVVIRENGIHRTPENLSDSEAAVTEPAAVAVHAVYERADVREGDLAVVSGPGAIGLLACQALMARGARVVLCGTDADLERFETAKALGVPHVVNVQKEDAAAAVRGLSGGLGARWAFECSGAPRGLAGCLAMVRRGGSIVQVGLFGRPVELDFDDLALREVTIVGVFGHTRETWPLTVSLLAEGKIRTGPLISGEYPLDRWSEAFGRFEKKDGLKFLLHPIE